MNTNTTTVVEDHSSFITVTQGMSGYFAVLMWWNDKDFPGEGFWEPYNTGIGRYATKEEAQEEAKFWAEDEELRYIP
jgi:hypothetical protein